MHVGKAKVVGDDLSVQVPFGIEPRFRGWVEKTWRSRYRSCRHVRYDERLGTWFLPLQMSRDVAELFIREGWVLEVEGGGIPGVPKGPPEFFASMDPVVFGAWAKLGVVPGSPRDVVVDAYRRLAIANHPDRGGDAAIMQEINNARDLLFRVNGW